MASRRPFTGLQGNLKWPTEDSRSPKFSQENKESKVLNVVLATKLLQPTERKDSNITALQATTLEKPCRL